ncbi:MAG: hypothetical protein IPJ65_06610 [Archangiaceae bacterium]|nr:hypothetical protein [Archangiaceae bacterium]
MSDPIRRSPASPLNAAAASPETAPKAAKPSSPRANPKGGAKEAVAGHGKQSSFQARRAEELGEAAENKRALGIGDESYEQIPVGADPLGLESPESDSVREAMYQRLESPRYLDVDELTPAKVPDLGPLGRELAALLSPAHAQAVLVVSQNDPVSAARLERLLDSTAGLPHPTRSALLEVLASEGPRSDAARALDELTRSNAFKRLTNSQKVQLSEVMTGSSAEGLVHLGAIVEASGERLLEQDSQGHTLLSNLHQIATQPLNAGLYRHTSTADLLGAVLRDVVNPARIDAGASAETTVGSLHWELLTDDRAEYARLLAGLTGPDSKATMAGGGVLRANPEAGLDEARYGRSISSALFQASTIEFAAAGDEFYSLSPAQQALLAGELFGVKYSAERVSGGRLPDSLRGFDARQTINRPVLVELAHDEARHTVTLERVGEGRVFFRDGYGELRSLPDASFARAAVELKRPLAIAAS